jgi:hypothetical protein
MTDLSASVGSSDEPRGRGGKAGKMAVFRLRESLTGAYIRVVV